METLMVDRVQSSLSQFMHRNAIFLCERLCAEFPTELNLQLMATCYLRNNQPYCAYHVLKGKQMAVSRYLFALSCFQMNLLREAEASLCPANEPNSEVPNGAAGHYLLGLIYRCTSRRAFAIEHFMQALAIDPLLWAAYEELCVLGAAEEANECFSDAIAVRIQPQYFFESSSQSIDGANEDHNLPSSRSVGSQDSPKQSKQIHAANNMPYYPQGVVTTANCIPSNLPLYNTPSPPVTQLSGIVPPPVYRNAYLNALGGDVSSKPNAHATTQAPRRKFMDEGKLRKVSGRLFSGSDSGPRRSARLSGDAMANVNLHSSQTGANGTNYSSAKFLGGFPSSKMGSSALRSVSNRKGQQLSAESFDEGRRPDTLDVPWSQASAAASSSLSMLSDGANTDQERGHPASCGTSGHESGVITGVKDLLFLLRILGEGYRLSFLYRCQDALEIYLKLPQHQYNTGWVLSQVGKLYFELVEYFEADRLFDLARRLSPCTLEGMDAYSTVLYHLKEEMKLSYLAQELVSIDRLCPQAWCAMGNCYSLQRDHETALKNFQRAVQLDSRFAYAHTLCGHEYIALEDYDNGIKCFHSALQVNERHYNSWYGLGIVFLRQEKFEFATHNFHRAYHINPRSSIIMSYLGMALHSLKRNDEALVLIDKAIIADKKNPLPMYEKANILVSLERYDEALNVLKQLIEFSPRESSVYALMGKIYKILNMHDKAMFYFGTALDLRPPAADVAVIKSAMEKLNLPDELEDSL
ncbi:cell division cycle protein 27 homolog B [Phalaenopsis equestris]|uniref:cell division cycle protein 27 homolog B n=1 Tax=Phalaenopsis equestris TaxID=78828 RepID=UPI0009E5A31F|nr:cell division cycle protein 27 homolog B [Phalaenopsis equestris]